MEVVWSSLAIEHFLWVLEYVETSFGSSIAQKTQRKIQDKIARLENHPRIGTPDGDYSFLINNLEVRHIILLPNIIYYLIDGDKVVIVSILHSRQSPESVQEIITDFLKQYK
ncbi:type II toxin-antitoxin system RelE/ParE family toxin [Parabacteroides sp.]